ncbi:hypothetical protein C8J95_104120 [Elizabethkingia sp. YR214]|nr:hypothetical protein C8J95_104120 [Elizabethkingia sp. YR214]
MQPKLRLIDRYIKDISYSFSEISIGYFIPEDSGLIDKLNVAKNKKYNF